MNATMRTGVCNGSCVCARDPGRLEDAQPTATVTCTAPGRQGDPAVPAGNAEIPSRRWSIMGTGVSGAVAVSYVSKLYRAAARFREASDRMCGRVLTAPKTLLPMNTTSPALELGAALVNPYRDYDAMHWLRGLGVPLVHLRWTPQASFVFLGGERLPWPLNDPPVYGSASASSSNASASNASVASVFAGASKAQVAEFLAWTGFLPSFLPEARAASVASMVHPMNAVTVGGLGVSAAITASTQGLPVQTGRNLASITLEPGGGLVRLAYSSGDEEVVGAALLTMPPPDLARIQGIDPRVAALAASAFTVVPVGVLVAQWAPTAPWWDTLGFQNGVAATDTALGRVQVMAPGVLRCTMASAEHVDSWTRLLAEGPSGLAQAKARVLSILRTILGIPAPDPLPEDALPATEMPQYLTFRPWPRGVSALKAGHDPLQVYQTLTRPCGPAVTRVWYTSADIDPVRPCSLQGAVSSAMAAAKLVCESCNLPLQSTAN